MNKRFCTCALVTVSLFPVSVLVAYAGMPDGTAVMLSRQQAIEDIDSLVYTLSDVHPNIFSRITPEKFFSQVVSAKQGLPDSLTTLELYRRVAPFVASISDGHTAMWYPYNDVFHKETPRFPLMVSVNANDSSITTRMPLYGVPGGARILTINGVSSRAMIGEMLRYASGERTFYKLTRVDGDFIAWFHMLYRAGQYKITYSFQGKTSTCTLPAVSVVEKQELMQKYQTKEAPRRAADFHIVDDRVAVMSVPSFVDARQIGKTCQEMIAQLRQKKIGNLIIDIRDNGGGTSMAADTLLSYLSPRPFRQYDKVWCKVTPLTQTMTRRPYQRGVYYDLIDEETLPVDSDRRFNGRVWVLVNHHSFSAASSFAWTFKAYGMGKLVGEETGGMNVSYGDAIQYTLPHSKLMCSISFKCFWLHDANENDIHGVIPDIQIESDRAMEKAMEEIIPSK